MGQIGLSLAAPNAWLQMACLDRGPPAGRGEPRSHGSMSRSCSIRRASRCLKTSSSVACFSICIRRPGCEPVCPATLHHRSAPISTGFSKDTRSVGYLTRASNTAICGAGSRTCIGVRQHLIGRISRPVRKSVPQYSVRTGRLRQVPGSADAAAPHHTLQWPGLRWAAGRLSLRTQTRYDFVGLGGGWSLECSIGIPPPGQGQLGA